jgi:hypothetical protein
MVEPGEVREGVKECVEKSGKGAVREDVEDILRGMFILPRPVTMLIKARPTTTAVITFHLTISSLDTNFQSRVPIPIPHTNFYILGVK